MKKVLKDIFLKVDVEYLEKLHEIHDLLFLPERMKIEKVEQLVANLSEYVKHIRNLKRALNHRLYLKNLRRVITFNQIAWCKIIY